MANCPDINKRRVHIRVELDVCAKVKKAFGRVGDKNENLAFARALEESVRGVELDAEDWQAIADEARMNQIKRS